MIGRFVTILFFVVSFTSLYGQKEKKITLFGDIHNAFIRNKQELRYKSLIVDKISLNGGAGFSVSNKISQRWYINYGMYYFLHSRWYQVFYSEDDIFPAASENTNLSYVKIPLLLQFDFIRTERIGLFFTAGPQISFLMVEDGALPVYEIYRDAANKPYILSFDQKEVGGAYKPLSFDGVASLGWDLKLSKKIYFNMQVRFDRSFTNIENEKYQFIQYENSANVFDFYTEPRLTTKAMTLGVMTGFGYKLH